MMIVAHMLPAADMHVEAEDGTMRTLPLGDAEFRASVFGGIAANLARWTPPLLCEHEREGGAEGFVRIVWEDAAGLFGLIEVKSDDAIEAIGSGLSRYVSVGMSLGASTSSGEKVPAILYEVSRVVIPAFLDGQQPIRIATAEDIARANIDLTLAINANSASVYFASGGAILRATQPTQTGSNMEEMMTQLAAITEMVKGMESRLAALEAAPVAAETEMIVEAGDMPMGMGMAPAEAEVYALRHIVKRPELAPLERTLITLAKVDKAACDDLAKIKLSAPATTTAPKLPVTQAAQTTPVAGDKFDLHAKALEIQTQRRATGTGSIKFEDCMSAARVAAGAQ